MALIFFHKIVTVNVTWHAAAEWCWRVDIKPLSDVSVVLNLCHKKRITEPDLIISGCGGFGPVLLTLPLHQTKPLRSVCPFWFRIKEFLRLKSKTCSDNLFPISLHTNQSFTLTTSLIMGEASRASPRWRKESVRSQSCDPFQSWTTQLSEILFQSQVCLTRYYRLCCVTFLLHAKPILFSLAAVQVPTWRLPLATQTCVGNSSLCAPHISLSWLWYSRILLPSSAVTASISFVVPACQPFTHQTLETTDVIEIFWEISDCGGPRQTPAGLTYQTWKPPCRRGHGGVDWRQEVEDYR